MKNYYIHDGQLERGPYNIVELQGKITKDTPVWKLGLSTWTRAEELKELHALMMDHVGPDSFRPKPRRPLKKRNYFSKLLRLARL